MSKRAEERALEAYSHHTAENLDDVIKARKFFAKGHEQAEKDLALTVEDIKTILDLSFWNDDPEKILDEYNRLCDTSKVTRR